MPGQKQILTARQVLAEIASGKTVIASVETAQGTISIPIESARDLQEFIKNHPTDFIQREAVCTVTNQS